MKIVSWNCNGALRKKLHQLLTIEADIYVVQECENPATCNDRQYKDWASNSLWIGQNKHKGLGVFASNQNQLEMLDWDSEGLESFLPCRINGNLTLVAVWTRQANSPTFGYIGQLWKYIQTHKANFSAPKFIISGDFNSNTCWDVWDRWWNHSDVVNELSGVGIESLYHRLYNEQQGMESRPTYYMYRKLAKPYHIDYVFLSQDLLNSARLTIGQPDNWLEFSDHMPLFFELEGYAELET